VRALVQRVLTSRAARSSPERRRAVYDYAAALTRGAEPGAAIPPDAEPYLRKVALDAYKVLDREVEALGAAGHTVADIFEMTVAASVSAGVARLEIALAALEEARDAAAS
jgi:alkylhydroperoxidase family enzyme